MKTSNYLIALAALTSFTFVSCSDNDFLGDGPGPVTTQQGNPEISFNAKGGKLTRGNTLEGKAASEKLGGHFTVYGWKTNTAESSSATGVTKVKGSIEDVYQDYYVVWQDGTAGTTESNTSNWEYVGQTSQPIDGEGVTQTIKYWDWSTYRYDFIAWSIKEGGSVLKERNKVVSTDGTIATANNPYLVFNAPTAKDLGYIYVSDKMTPTPDGVHPKDISNNDVLVDATAAKHSLGTYNQEVGLQFRSLAAKVRIGIYETIPGYQVSDVEFYKAEGGAKSGYAQSWAITTGDYPCNYKYATLFAAANIFGNSGDVTVRYNDQTYTYDPVAKKDDNTAYTTTKFDTDANFFAFGELTNTKTAGTKVEIAKGEAIGTTSNTATMSIGNDDDKFYTFVFPMEDNVQPLELKVNYTLTSTDGSGEKIKVTGANATVPAQFAMWNSNYAYTYLFKISDNTNGYSGTETSDPKGLYPITFAAYVVDAELGNQETITTVNDKSITTYQDGSEILKDNEYKNGIDIYVAAENAEELTPSTNFFLYIADGTSIEKLTEEVALNYINNPYIFTDISSTVTLNVANFEVPNSSGHGHGIKFATANTIASFKPLADHVYVVKYIYGSGTTNESISYKVIKVGAADKATRSFTVLTTAGTIATGESTTFTLKNNVTVPLVTGASGSASAADYAVTGAQANVKIMTAPTSGDPVDVTTKFEIKEASTAGTYSVKAVTAEAGDYKVVYGTAQDATHKITVTAPVWSESSVTIEAGNEATVKLEAKSGTALAGVTPKVEAQSGATGTLTASTTVSTGDDIGKTTLKASADASGLFNVSYNGAVLPVYVDKFTIGLSRSIINVAASDDYKKATVTLTNANSGTGYTSTGSQNIVSSAAAVVANVTTGSASGTSATGTATAIKAGTVTLTYGNAKNTIEVVDYKLETLIGQVRLTNKAVDASSYEPVKNATFVVKKAGAVVNNVKVQATSTDGVYNVIKGTGAESGTYVIEYKYKGVVIVTTDITL